MNRFYLKFKLISKTNKIQEVNCKMVNTAILKLRNRQIVQNNLIFRENSVNKYNFRRVI